MCPLQNHFQGWWPHLSYESGGVHLFCILIGNRHIIRYGVSGRGLELALIARVPSGPQGVTCHQPESKQQYSEKIATWGRSVQKVEWWDHWIQMSGLASMLTHSGSFSPKSTPGKWSLITNLSAPLHVSANDGISKELSSFSYISVDLVAEQGSRWEGELYWWRWTSSLSIGLCWWSLSTWSEVETAGVCGLCIVSGQPAKFSQH